MDYLFIIYVLIYNILKEYIKNFNCQKFFNIFENYVDDYCFLKNIDYYGIEKNLGQNYYVNKEEEYLIEDPNITKKINPKKNITKDNYIIPNFLPPEIQSMIFEYLDFKEICTISNICYYWYKLSIDDKYWRKLFNKEYDIDKVEESDMKQLFKLYYLDKNIENKIKNRKRIIKCVNQINLIYQKN